MTIFVVRCPPCRGVQCNGVKRALGASLSRSAASASGVSMSTSTLSLSISTSHDQFGVLADQMLGPDIAG